MLHDSACQCFYADAASFHDYKGKSFNFQDLGEKRGMHRGYPKDSSTELRAKYMSNLISNLWVTVALCGLYLDF